jgi:putative transposase
LTATHGNAIKNVGHAQYGGMDVSDAKRLKALEAENARLKRLLAEAMLENEVTKEALRKKW